jgi:hypothetical protein
MNRQHQDTEMIPTLLRREQLFFLFAWSLLVFSVCQLIKTYIYILDEWGWNYIFIISLLQAIFFFLYFLLLRVRFDVSLKFPYYIAVCIVYAILIFLFACLYHSVVILYRKHYYLTGYLDAGLLNIVLSGILFLLTLIKRK